MKGTYLGEFEELVLLAVGILFGDAYGLAIIDELEKKTGRNIMISSVHKTLVRLEEKAAPAYAAKIEALLQEKQQELKAHREIEPEKVEQPGEVSDDQKAAFAQDCFHQESFRPG